MDVEEAQIALGLIRKMLSTFCSVETRNGETFLAGDDTVLIGKDLTPEEVEFLKKYT